MSILSPGTGESSIYFGNPGTNGQKDAWIKYYHETHSTTANRRALTFRTSGVERFRIDNNGRVGINSSIPLNTLVVQEPTDNNPSIKLFRHSTGGDIASIVWATNSGSQAQINYRGGSGSEGLQFYTGGTGSSNLRAIIDTDGKIGIGTHDPQAPVHIDGGTTGTQRLRVQNHQSVGAFSGNYGSEFRHAYSSANHCMLIHAQEAADARRTLDISDSNGVFASFTNHKMGLGTGITSPNATLDIRTTNDDDAIRLVNTSTGNNGIQWWNEYGGLTKRVSMDYGEGDANFDIKSFRGDAQNDRPYGNVRIYTGSTSSPNMNFRVTTLGTVHQPNQPAFYVRDSVSSSAFGANSYACLLYTSPSPRDRG